MLLNLIFKMNTKNYKNLLFILLVGIVSTSCNNKRTQDTANDIQFDSIKVEKIYHLLDNPKNPNCNLQINFVYPVACKNKEILPKLQQNFVMGYFGENYVTLPPAAALEKYVADYLAAYKDLEKDFIEESKKADDNTSIGAWFSYYENSSDKIVYNSNDIISYTINFENYTGGAHGAHSYQNHVINSTTGDPITEDDIFISNFQDELAHIIIDKITEQNNLKDSKELENIGFFSIDEIFPNGNFLVAKNGITYTFNEYEIAAYAVGPINVFIPYNELELLLKKDSPIYKLAEN